MSMHKILAVVGLACVGLFSVWSDAVQEKPFESEALKLLQDKIQPWWNSHRPPRSTKPMEYRMTPADDLGSRVDPPIYTPQMPIEVAAWIHSGGKPAEGNPMSGRPLVLLDVRRRSDFLSERIPGSLNVPARDLETSLESGDLSKLDARSVLVAFGSKWPHLEVISRIRATKKFEALYAMEGLEAWKARRAPVDRDEKLVQFLKETESERKAGAPPPPPPEPEPLAGVDPRALKKLLDSGVDLLRVFVGDRKTYEDGHVPGTHHVPTHDIEKWFADVDKNKLVMVMCGCCMGERGGPSENAVRQLEKMGFTRVLHLDGHMNAWKAAGLPVEHEDPPPRKK